MNKKGLTLVELAVVMVIIGVVAALAVPNVGRWLPNYRLRSATRDIVSTLRLAQMKAVSTSLNYQVSFNVAGGNYILQRNTGGLWVNEGGSQALPSGISLNTTFANNTALFRSDSSSNGGSVVLQNSKGGINTVTVLFTTGKITIK